MKLATFVIITLTLVVTLSATLVRPGMTATSSSGRIVASRSLNLWVMNADGSQISMLDTQNNGLDTEPAWSPDGSQIAFRSQRGASVELWAINSDNSGLTRLTNNTVFDREPTWSPNGQQIAFTSSESSCNTGIYVLNVDGSLFPDGSSQKLIKCGGSSPHWSPAGDKIVYLSGINDDIHVMNSDGSGAQKLINTTDDFITSPPRLSPDGSKILYTTLFDVKVIDANGTNSRTIYTDFSSKRDPTWSPNGKHIAYVGSDGIYVLEVGQRTPQKIVDGGYSHLDWTAGSGNQPVPTPTSIPTTTPTEEPTPLPPATITDLRAEPGVVSGTVKLKWTAPASASGGRVAGYEIRYSSQPINATNWVNAAAITNPPTPASPSSLEEMTIPSLSSNTTWYFAIKSHSSPNIWSNLSNIPSWLDSGFRPNPDGYSFVNFAADKIPLTVDDLVEMFGYDAVHIWGFVDPRASYWLNDKLSVGSGGLCYGFASTSSSFFAGNSPQPASLVPRMATVYDLPAAPVNTVVFNHIGKNFVRQLVNPVKAYTGSSSNNPPSIILESIHTAMVANKRQAYPILLLWYHQTKDDGSKGKSVGHAITPYAITKVTDRGGKHRVWVYDNNYPNQTDRYVEIDPISEEWSYHLSENPYRKGNIVDIAMVTASEHNEPAVCPWCLFSSLMSGWPEGQVWSSGTGNLLLTDSQSRRIGFADAQFVNEIPEAYETIIIGGLETPLEPLYTIPLSDTYSILVDGQTLTRTETIDISQYGPGYVAALDDIQLGVNEQDLITISPDGSQITYQADATRSVTITLTPTSPGVDEAVYGVYVRGVDVGAQQMLAASADSAQDKLILDHSQNDSGDYGLEINRINATGIYTFTHSAIPVSATDTHYLNYGTWDGSGPMILEIDRSSDGSIDEVINLPNMYTPPSSPLYLPLIQR